MIELYIPKACAMDCSHSGACDDDVAAWRTTPKIARQLAKLQPDAVREALEGYGAWDADELSDHDANLTRILWITACNAREEKPFRSWQYIG